MGGIDNARIVRQNKGTNYNERICAMSNHEYRDPVTPELPPEEDELTLEAVAAPDPLDTEVIELPDGPDGGPTDEPDDGSSDEPDEEFDDEDDDADDDEDEFADERLAAEAPDEVPDEVAAVAAGTVAARGLGAFLAARRAQLSGAVGSWLDNRVRAAHAREHVAAEQALAREAVSRLPALATTDQLHDMIATIRQERADAAAAKAVAEQEARDRAEADRLEAAARSLEHAAANVHGPAYAQHEALYAHHSNGAQAAWNGMQVTSAAGREALRQAQEARDRAAALRSQYEEPAEAAELLAA